MLCKPKPSPFYLPSRPRLQRLIRLNPTTLTLQRILTRLLGNRPLAILLILGERLIPIKVLINNTAHATLAMVSIDLTAVVPKGLFILHLERKHVVGLALLCGEVEAAEDTGAVG